MTPKEKAKELVYKYKYLVQTWDCYNDEPLEIKYRLPDMKKCALIAVDELIEHLQPASDFGGEINKYTIEYWEEVKQKIEKQ